MMDLTAGMKVKFKSKFLEGTGEILYIDPEAYFAPIAVKLDNAIDNHSYYRFYHSEVKPLVELVSNSLVEVSPTIVELNEAARAFLLSSEQTSSTHVKPEAPEMRKEYIIEKNPPKKWLVKLTKKVTGYSFEAAEIFIASETGSIYNTCFYIYDPYTLKLRGCMLKEAFEVLREVKEGEKFEDFRKPRKAKKSQSKVKVSEREKQPKKAEKKQRKPKNFFEVMEAKGQTNIFEFLEA